MNIGIVGRTMNTVGGVKEFVEGLCYGLNQIELNNDRFFFFLTEDGQRPRYDESITVVHEGNSSRLWWDYVVLPRLVKKYNIDILLHIKNTIPASVVNVPGVVVVHDLLYFLNPQVYRWSEQLYTRNFMRFSIPRASGVVAVSHNTKKDLLTHLPQVKEDRVHVVHENAMPRYGNIYSQEQVDLFRKEMNLPERYLLFTGSLSPRKNLERLLRAIKKIKDDIPHHIVVTGSKAWKHRSLYDVLDELNLKDRVHILGFVEDDDMPLLYQNADAYIYPSLYEGFGIPVLEAFNSGVPVICSNVSSIPEVADTAVAYFDPTSIDDMARVIQKTVTSPERLAKLKEKGFRRSRDFSWVDSSRDILDVLRKTYQNLPKR